MQFHIENMTCGGCACGVTRAIHTVDPAANVEADPPKRKVVVTSGQPRAAFEAALAEAGFPVAPVGRSPDEQAVRSAHGDRACRRGRTGRCAIADRG